VSAAITLSKKAREGPENRYIPIRVKWRRKLMCPAEAIFVGRYMPNAM
jgi:hypothetical protein